MINRLLLALLVGLLCSNIALAGGFFGPNSFGGSFITDPSVGPVGWPQPDAYWHSTVSGNDVVDDTGNGNNLISTGTTTTDGDDYVSFDLDVATGTMDTASGTFGTAAADKFTVVGWVYYNSGATIGTSNSIWTISKDLSAYTKANYGNIVHISTSGTVSWYSTDASTNTPAVSGDTFDATEKWFCVGTTYEYIGAGNVNESSIYIYDLNADTSNYVAISNAPVAHNGATYEFRLTPNPGRGQDLRMSGLGFFNGFEASEADFDELCKNWGRTGGVW